VDEGHKGLNSIKLSEGVAGVTSITSQILHPTKLSTGTTTQRKKLIIEAGAHTRAEALLKEVTNALAVVASKPTSSMLNTRKKTKST
jgi:hypothetical protein